jgi:predicted RNA-binding Zn ribbon-like protein
MEKEETSGTAPEQRRFSFLGGALPLDYCNTVDWHSSPEPTDRLFRYEDLLDWGTAAGTLSLDEMRAVEEEANARPMEAEAVFREAIELRETLFRLLSAAAHETDPASEDVARLNDWLARTQRVLELRYDADEYRWAWRTDQLSTDLVRPMYPVVLAAMELLLSPKRRDVRRCEGPPGCGWLFLDHTKNHSRRWCSMRDCGNRAKMRRFQEKKKNNRGNEG